MTTTPIEKTLSHEITEALERNNSCPAVEVFMQQHLQHPLPVYKRVARLIGQESSSGALQFFYSLRGYAPEEIQRLQKVGWDIRNDDVIFREGQAAFGALVHPLETKLSDTEKRRMAEVQAQFDNQRKARMASMPPPIPKAAPAKIVELP